MRKHKPEKRKILPDPVYNSKLITRVINKIMLDGKKGLAQKILYQSFDLVKEKTKKEPLDVFKKALSNVMPNIELKVRKIGGSNYQIPIETSEDRRMVLGLRWIINYSRLRNEKTIIEKLANEIIDAANGTGSSVKKREDTRKMAEANKAFAHYRW